jgi:hypothetical protein
LPNRFDNLLRRGFRGDGMAYVSNRLSDEDHLAAGASQVCLQVLMAEQTTFRREQWSRLAAACHGEQR